MKMAFPQSSVHGVVFRDYPIAFFVLERYREQLFVGSGLAGSVEAFAAVVQDAERRVVFPIHYFPGKQRVLSL
jgi:hypothetical protein